MTSLTKPEIDADIISMKTVEDGYSHIPASVYVNDGDEREIQILQGSYFVLPPDDKGGNRFRSYKPLHLINDEIIAVENAGYSQSKEYNADLGGLVRKIPPMDEKIFSLDVVQKIIRRDIEIASQMGILDFEKPIKIGLHSVRYNPTVGKTSFSSPPGLHKDDEDIVFIHIINVSGNLMGGENVICAYNKPKISKNGEPPFLAHINMRVPIEALCVTKKHFHQVFPMSVSFGKSAYRDILLVTFENFQEKLEYVAG